MRYRHRNERKIEIRSRNKILILSGAGISTSAGLPDFRSRNGIYKQVHEKHPDLKDPKSMFDIRYFKKNPQPFYYFAKALFPGQFEPTIGHKFIKCVEEHGKLLNNYTQNIDTIERQAGIKRVVECHGSFSQATCTSCRFKIEGSELRNDIFNQRIPICPKCHSTDDGPADGLGIMKPDIVFFGEPLGPKFHDSFERDKEQLDLLIVIGSSLKVRPVALLPNMIPQDVPQILINREPLDYFSFDIELLGNCDEILQEICRRLGDGWKEICPETESLIKLSGPEHIKISEEKQETADESKATSSSSLGLLNESDDKKTTSSNIELGNKDASANEHDEDEAKPADKLQDGQDSDWEDIDVDSEDTSEDEYSSPKKLDLDIPKNSYIFIKPNKHFFTGAEMTEAQYERKVREF